MKIVDPKGEPVRSERRRTGKIARLSFEIRDQVNRMLRDGVPYVEIISYCESQDHPGINEVNISAWKDGGYQDWLAQQERLLDMQNKREFALEIVKANEGSKIHEAGLQLAASQIYELLTDIDLVSIKELLADKPTNYSKIVNSLAKLAKEALGFEKYKAACADAQAEIQKLRDPSATLSDEERKVIVDKVDQILGLK